MKKEITIVTEGEFDARVLKKLLAEKTPGVKINVLAASGYSAALSKVRSLLTMQDKNIILILDTDTVDKDGIREKEDFVNSYLSANHYKENFRAFWAIPEFEIIFLNNPKLLSGLTKKKFSKDLLEIGQTSPRQTLETISKKGKEDFILLLENEEIRNEFFKEGLVKELYDYLNKNESAEVPGIPLDNA